MKKEKMQEIFTTLERKRDKAKLECERREEFIKTKFPIIEEIETQIAKIGLGVTKAILMKRGNIEKLQEEATKEIQKLSLQKEEILIQNGFPKDFMQVRYECNKCNDTGYVKIYNKDNNIEGSEKCICLKQMIIKKLYSDSNMQDIIESQNFANFDFDLFPDNQKDESGLTQRENMEIIVKDMYDFIENFRPKSGNNILFMGGTGTGKTFLCSCIAKAVLDKEYTVVYRTAKKTIDTIFEYNVSKNKYNENENNSEAYEQLFECDLLIIDDLGTEMINSYSVTEMFNLINERILSKKSTIISTNLSFRKIQEYYTQRLTSRIAEHYVLYKFFGNDLRIDKFVRANRS